MPDLKSLSPQKLCLAYTRWVYVAAAIIITFYALVRTAPPSLYTLPIVATAQNVFDDYVISESNLDSRAEDILFEDFGAIRRTISEVIAITSSSEKLERKFFFLDVSIDFLRERLESILQTSDRFGQIIGTLFPR